MVKWIGTQKRADAPEYRRFVELVELHRSLVGQVDQKVGREKAIMRKYIAALDRRLVRYPNRAEYYATWRRDSSQGA